MKKRKSIMKSYSVVATTLLFARCAPMTPIVYSPISDSQLAINKKAAAALPVQPAVPQQISPERPPSEFIRASHPGDKVWCRTPEAADWIISSMGRMADIEDIRLQNGLFKYMDSEQAKIISDGDRVVKVSNVTEGYVTCFSTVPGMCKPDLSYRICHATAQLRNGRVITGNFGEGKMQGMGLGLNSPRDRFTYFDIMTFNANE